MTEAERILQEWVDTKSNKKIANEIIKCRLIQNKLTAVDICFAYMVYNPENGKNRLYEVLDEKYKNKLILDLAGVK